MRALKPAYIAASVVLALASLAAGAVNSVPRMTTAAKPTTGAPPAVTTTPTTTTGTGTGNTSGSTSTGTGTTSTNSTTTTVTAGGTSTGSALNDSAGRNVAASLDTRNVSTGGAATNAALSPNAQTTTTTATGQVVGGAGISASTATTGATTGTTGAFVGGAPGAFVVLNNGASFAVNGVTANGELAATGNAFVEESTSLPENQNVIVTQSGSILVPALTDLERKELRKRQNVPRNRQLLSSIAPRTNVDRTWQMPDDPVSPALRTGTPLL